MIIAHGLSPLLSMKYVESIKNVSVLFILLVDR